MMWWPAIGGLAVGIGGLIEPRALGVGYDTISALLAGQLAGLAVARLMAVKALIWAIALGSGTSGGVLAPLLIMGGSFGAIGAGLIPFGDAASGQLFGMAAMLGGTMRSPLTAAVFPLELTHDLSIVPALFLACVTAHGFTVLVMRRSILTEKVARRGYHIAREYTVSPLARFRVEDVMEREVPTIPAAMPADALLRRLANDDPVLAPCQAWPIIDGAGALVGIITRRDLIASVDREGADTLSVLGAGSTPAITTYPDTLLEEAVSVMLARKVSRLPVVAREDATPADWPAQVAWPRARVAARVRRRAVPGVDHATERPPAARPACAPPHGTRGTRRRNREGHGVRVDQRDSARPPGVYPHMPASLAPWPMRSLRGLRRLCLAGLPASVLWAGDAPSTRPASPILHRAATASIEGQVVVSRALTARRPRFRIYAEPGPGAVPPAPDSVDVDERENIIVYIEQAPSGTAEPTKGATLRQHDERFLPHVLPSYGARPSRSLTMTRCSTTSSRSRARSRSTWDDIRGARHVP